MKFNNIIIHKKFCNEKCKEKAYMTIHYFKFNKYKEHLLTLNYCYDHFHSNSRCEIFLMYKKITRVDKDFPKEQMAEIKNECKTKARIFTTGRILKYKFYKEEKTQFCIEHFKLFKKVFTELFWVSIPIFGGKSTFNRYALFMKYLKPQMTIEIPSHLKKEGHMKGEKWNLVKQ